MNGAEETTILGRQVALLYRNLRLGQIVSILNALFIAWVASPHLAPLPLAAWVTATIVIAGLRLALNSRYHRIAPAERDAQAPFWRQRAILGALLGGITWAAGAILLMTAGDPFLKLFVAFVMAGMVAGAVPVVAADLAAFRSYAWPVVLAVTVCSFSPDRMGVAFSLMSLLFLLIVSRSAQFFNQALHDAIHLEHQQAQLAQGQEHARQVAEQALRAKTQFLANISHELRTPMNGIIGIADLLNLDASGEQRDLLAHLRGSADQLLQKIEHLIHLSELEAGHVKLGISPLLIDELLSSLVVDNRQAARARGLTITCEVAPDLHEALMADVDCLRKALQHLLENAIKFTDCGSVRLCARVRERDASTVRVEFQVIDSGHGLTAEALRAIDGLLTQADGSSVRRHGGIGVGLAIVRRLIELHGGEMRISSQPGVGSSFGFVVPLGLADPLPERA